MKLIPLNVDVPEELRGEVDKAAERDFTNRTEFVKIALITYMAGRDDFHRK
jgi:metal-responsive CopG/Arc/MetJ family transcriptional regulator|tara:strand:- start:189 stop:341 length:153 start_codon:yes stop_codon:yes gene_type:complete